MGTGLFIVRPTGGTAITCSMSDLSTQYFVPFDKVDWNESEREKIAYSEGNNGQLVGVTHELVDATFQVHILGSSFDDIGAKLRTLSQALRNPSGGMIEFRPLEYSNSVRSTYYHYLRSAPPRFISTSGASSDGSTNRNMSKVYEFTVKIKPWATSNPASPTTLVSPTTIQNRYESGSAVNYLTVSAASIVGDVAFPVINLDYLGGTVSNTSAGSFFVSIRSYTGSASHSEWIEASASNMATSAAVTDAIYSDGTARRLTSAGSMVVNFATNTLDNSYLGQSVILIAARIETGSTEWEAVLVNYTGSPLIGVLAGLQSINPITLDNTNTRPNVYAFPATSMPPWKIPGDLSDADVANFMAEGGLAIQFTRTVGSGNLVVDWLFMLKGTEWVGKFESPLTTSAIIAINDSVVIDSYRQVAYALASDDDIISPLSKSGNSLNDLFLIAGRNYTINFLSLFSSDLYEPLEEWSASVSAVFGTIYPFES